MTLTLPIISFCVSDLILLFAEKERGIRKRKGGEIENSSTEEEIYKIERKKEGKEGKNQWGKECLYERRATWEPSKRGDAWSCTLPKGKITIIRFFQNCVLPTFYPCFPSFILENSLILSTWGGSFRLRGSVTFKVAT